jgi:hypothetical protein
MDGNCGKKLRLRGMGRYQKVDTIRIEREDEATVAEKRFEGIQYATRLSGISGLRPQE